MRRLLPWVLVALVVLGTAAGAALGIVHRSSPETPSRWVAAVLATTEKAGTATFSYTQVTSSSNADLRGSQSGHGAVDFGSGDARVTEVDHEVSFNSTNNQPIHAVHTTDTLKAIVIGGTVYQADPIAGIGFTSDYRILPFPKLPRSQRGLSLALGAAVPLDALRGPNAVASVIDVGPATIGGTATTEYEVTYAPLHVCAPHQPPATPEPGMGRRRGTARPGAQHLLLQRRLAPEREGSHCLRRVSPGPDDDALHAHVLHLRAPGARGRTSCECARSPRGVIRRVCGRTGRQLFLPVNSLP
jgi:hypothetical protein